MSRDVCLIETSAGYQINVDRILTFYPHKGGTMIIEQMNGYRNRYLVRELPAQITRAIVECTKHRQ